MKPDNAGAPLPSLPFLRQPAGGAAASAAAAPEKPLPDGGAQNIDLHALVREAVIAALERSQAENSCVRSSGGDALKFSMAGRVKAVDAQKLPWEAFQGKTDGQVNIVDVITPSDGSPIGGGYLEWNKASFAWRLTYAEIDVVLEGELHISSGGKTVIGRPGDMLFIPQDTDVVFSSPGYVRFAYTTWPADWSSLVEPQNGGS